MPKDKNKKKDKKSGEGKMPKQLRNIGRKAMKLADNPVVSEVVAAALLSAAAALRENDGARGKAVKAGKVALDAAEGLTRSSSKVGDSLRKLALDLARRTLDSWDGQDSPAAASAKPPRSPKPGKPPKPQKPPKPPKPPKAVTSGAKGGKSGKSGSRGKG